MSPLFLLCVLFLSCSVASRGGDFALCKPLTLQWSAGISTFSQPTKIQHSLSFLHSLPCLNLCFNRKLLPIPRSTPTFKLAIILLLAGDFNLHSNPEYFSFESISVEISYSSFSAYFVCIYRPPGHPADFFEEFQDLLENLATIHSEFYIFGDFNLHLDIPSAITTTFNDILVSFDLKQHVTFSTHINGHFAEIVPQSVHGWIGGMNLVYREHFFAPILHVALFELTFVLADAHAIRHTQLGHALTATPFPDSLHLPVTEPCAVRSTSVPTVSEHLQERVLVDGVVTFTLPFGAVLVGGSEAIVRLAAQHHKPVIGPLDLKQTRCTLVERSAYLTARLVPNPRSIGESTAYVLVPMCVAKFGRQPFGTMSEIMIS